MMDIELVDADDRNETGEYLEPGVMENYLRTSDLNKNKLSGSFQGKDVTATEEFRRGATCHCDRWEVQHPSTSQDGTAS